MEAFSTQPLWVDFATGCKPTKTGAWDSVEYFPDCYEMQNLDDGSPASDRFDPFYVLGETCELAILDIPMAKLSSQAFGVVAADEYSKVCDEIEANLNQLQDGRTDLAALRHGRVVARADHRRRRQPRCWQDRPGPALSCRRSPATNRSRHACAGACSDAGRIGSREFGPVAKTSASSSIAFLAVMDSVSSRVRQSHEPSPVRR